MYIKLLTITVDFFYNSAFFSQRCRFAAMWCRSSSVNVVIYTNGVTSVFVSCFPLENMTYDILSRDMHGLGNTYVQNSYLVV